MPSFLSELKIPFIWRWCWDCFAFVSSMFIIWDMATDIRFVDLHTANLMLNYHVSVRRYKNKPNFHENNVCKTTPYFSENIFKQMSTYKISITYCEILELILYNEHISPFVIDMEQNFLHLFRRHKFKWHLIRSVFVFR